MKKEQNFKTVEEAKNFLKNLKSLFIEGDPNEFTNEEIIMMANYIYKAIYLKEGK